MYRIRIYARINQFWNPCVKALDVEPGAETNAFLAALELVSIKTKGIVTHTYSKK